MENESRDKPSITLCVQAVERLKARGYVPWMSADELQQAGKDALREFEQFAVFLERKGVW